MAGSWIKMRGGLLHSPKLIRVSHELAKCVEFREWLMPDPGDCHRPELSNHALRTVTLALLCVVWSWAREHGKIEDDDLILPHIKVTDIDEMIGVPGIGKAMSAVNWAIEDTERDCVILPNFKEHNVPKTQAEKQKAYRERKQSTVTKSLPTKSNNEVTKAMLCNVLSSNLKYKEIDTPEFKTKLQEWLQYRDDHPKRLTPYTEQGIKSVLTRLSKMGSNLAIESIDFSMGNMYQGIIEASDRSSDKAKSDGVQASVDKAIRKASK